mgnify:CR=1 FL=1
MKTNKSIRFDDEQLQELERVAAERGLTLAGLVRMACEVFLLKQELAVELDGMETNLATSMARVLNEVARVGDDVQLLIALFDQLARFQFITTPEVIDKEAAAAIGSRRHAGFMEELHKAFHSRHRKSKLAKELDAMGGDGDGN